MFDIRGPSWHHKTWRQLSEFEIEVPDKPWMNSQEHKLFWYEIRVPQGPWPYSDHANIFVRLSAGLPSHHWWIFTRQTMQGAPWLATFLAASLICWVSYEGYVARTQRHFLLRDVPMAVSTTPTLPSTPMYVQAALVSAPSAPRERRYLRRGVSHVAWRSALFGELAALLLCSVESEPRLRHTDRAKWFCTFESFEPSCRFRESAAALGEGSHARKYRYYCLRRIAGTRNLHRVHRHWWVRCPSRWSEPSFHRCRRAIRRCLPVEMAVRAQRYSDRGAHSTGGLEMSGSQGHVPYQPIQILHRSSQYQLSKEV